jgi:hypothetical protein
MPEAVGDAFMIENVTAVDEFLFKLFELDRIKSRCSRFGGSHGDSFATKTFVDSVLLAGHPGVKPAIGLTT